MSAKELLETWFRRVWFEGDLAAIDEMFGPASRAEGVMEFAVTAADFKALVPAFLSHVERPVIEMPHTVEQGDWIAAFVTVHARAVIGGGPVVFTGQILARIDQGRFAEVYNSFDFLGFFEQIGLLPHDTLPLCLAGERIGD